MGKSCEIQEASFLGKEPPIRVSAAAFCCFVSPGLSRLWHSTEEPLSPKCYSHSQKNVPHYQSATKKHLSCF